MVKEVYAVIRRFFLSIFEETSAQLNCDTGCHATSSGYGKVWFAPCHWGQVPRKDQNCADRC